MSLNCKREEIHNLRRDKILMKKFSVVSIDLIELTSEMKLYGKSKYLNYGNS